MSNIISIILSLVLSLSAQTAENSEKLEIPKEQLYYPKCEVIALVHDETREYDPNLTFIKTADGDIFAFWSCDLFIGDEFYALFNDNGTPYDKTDDEYIRVWSWNIDE